MVARDISSRGVLSEAGLAVLFKLHIERNKHQLREVSQCMCTSFSVLTSSVV